jgi:hypothetical protein
MSVSVDYMSARIVMAEEIITAQCFEAYLAVSGKNLLLLSGYQEANLLVYPLIVRARGGLLW